MKAKPIPLIEATGTRMERMCPESVKNWIALERNWLNVLAPEPILPFGKISTWTRPLGLGLDLFRGLLGGQLILTSGATREPAGSAARSSASAGVRLGQIRSAAWKV